MLLTLDSHTVDLSAPGVDRTDDDFALAWIRNYGKGRVFYSAFGHFPRASLKNPSAPCCFKRSSGSPVRSTSMPLHAPAPPRPHRTSSQTVSANFSGIAEAVDPGNIIAITGDRLTSGSFFAAAATPLPVRLAGTHIDVNGTSAPLLLNRAVCYFRSQPTSSLASRQRGIPVRLVLMLAAFFVLLLSVLGALVWRTRRTYAGSSRQTIANLLFSLCLRLFAFRLALPDWIGVMAANAVLAAAAILSLEATRKYRGLCPRVSFGSAGGILAVLAVVYFD